ncbi:MAG: crossover junction endodeoxyribonuclease RuvC [Flavobacteriales bacterium AspAUS03]
MIETYQSDELAIELHFFWKNIQSILKLGAAQGVAIAVSCAARYSSRNIHQKRSR